MTTISWKKQRAEGLEKMAKGGALFAEGARMVASGPTSEWWSEKFEEMLRCVEETAKVAAHKAVVIREELAKDEREGGVVGERKRAKRHKKAGPSCVTAMGPERNARSVHGGKVARDAAVGKAILLAEEEA